MCQSTHTWIYLLRSDSLAPYKQTKLYLLQFLKKKKLKNALELFSIFKDKSAVSTNKESLAKFN